MRPASCPCASLHRVLITALKLPVELMPRHHKGGGAAAVFRKFRRAGCAERQKIEGFVCFFGLGSVTFSEHH